MISCTLDLFICRPSAEIGFYRVGVINYYHWDLGFPKFSFKKEFENFNIAPVKSTKDGIFNITYMYRLSLIQKICGKEYKF